MPLDDNKQEETKKEETKEEVKEETKQEVSLDDNTKEALEIYEILQDPGQSIKFIENLARQAGLLTAETKKEEKAATKLAKDIIKTHLGDEYKHVADKLGDAIQEILDERDGQLKIEISETRKNQAERQFSNDFDTFVKDQEVSEEEAGAILKQLEIMSPNPKVPLKKFLAEQLELVRYRTGKDTGSKERSKRQAENFRNRGSSVGSDTGEKLIQQPKNPSVRDAVLAAARGEKWE
jgi:hypothetical protein